MKITLTLCKIQVIEIIAVILWKLIVNNLEAGNKTFYGDFTFRKKKAWISDLDMFNKLVIPSVSNFTINKDLELRRVMLLYLYN